MNPTLQSLEDRAMPALRRMHPASLTLILVLLWTLVVGLLSGFWIMPAWRAWKAAQADQAVLEAQTALPSSALGDPSRLRAEIAAIVEQMSSVPHGLTRGAVAMERLRRSAVDAGFPRVDVKLIGESAAGPREGLRFGVDLSGDYARVGGWLERIPHELPWLELRRIEFSRGGGEATAAEVVLRLQGVLPPDIQGAGS